MRSFKCEDCGHTWKLPFGQGGWGVYLKCPQCSSRNVYRSTDERGGRGRFRGSWGRGRGHWSAPVDVDPNQNAENVDQA